ncbi:MAG: hypothetical protein ABSA33_06300, partial [Candidatus Micrarchaeaceae archaeon]
FRAKSVMEKKRMEELLIRLSERMVVRKQYCWEPAKKSWLENAENEHDLSWPFQAILARGNPRDKSYVLTEDELYRCDSELWDIRHGRTVRRKASEMAQAILPMLKCCTTAKFIDPNISLDKVRYRRSLSAFFQCLRGNAPSGKPRSIEIHTSDSCGASTEYLRDRYQSIVPRGMDVTLFQWKEKPNGLRLHNRYVLTDLGGVSFQHGLDEGREGDTDDLNLLEIKQYKERWEQYALNSSAFDVAEEPMVISGMK